MRQQSKDVYASIKPFWNLEEANESSKQREPERGCTAHVDLSFPYASLPKQAGTAPIEAVLGRKPHFYSTSALFHTAIYRRLGAPKDSIPPMGPRTEKLDPVLAVGK